MAQYRFDQTDYSTNNDGLHTDTGPPGRHTLDPDERH